jgi:energy-coupling factor transporter ATP-binding protein EcfA2
LNKASTRSRVELGLEYAPEKVEHPWETIVQEVGKADRAVQPGQRTIDVFDSLGGELLILGAPGSGKTTLLLELARDLIERARQDEQYPIPIVFNLSTWSVKRMRLSGELWEWFLKWLIEELNQRYDVPKKVSKEWIDSGAILLLLDGLDEVSKEHRLNCVEAINNYRKEKSFGPLAVCSRVTDYELLSTQLRLMGAVTIQPLAQEQVEVYLAKAGPQLEDVWVTMQVFSAVVQLVAVGERVALPTSRQRPSKTQDTVSAARGPPTTPVAVGWRRNGWGGCCAFLAFHALGARLVGVAKAVGLFLHTGCRIGECPAAALARVVQGVVDEGCS